MDPSDTYQLIILLILLTLSAFFSSFETALMSVNKIKLRTLADDGNKRAELTLNIIEKQMPKVLSAILIGNNIVNLSASTILTTLVIHLFGNYATGIATGIMTILVLIFGEISPKNAATVHADKIALAYAPVINLLMYLFTPIIFIVDSYQAAYFVC